MNALVTSSLTPLVPLAKELDKNKVTPGVLGFLVFAALGVAVWLLLKSMNTRLTKINFEERPAQDGNGEARREDQEAGGAGRTADSGVQGGGATRPSQGPASA